MKYEPLKIYQNKYLREGEYEDESVPLKWDSPFLFAVLPKTPTCKPVTFVWELTLPGK